MKKAIFALAFVCTLVPLTFSATDSALGLAAVPQGYRGGLRNSRGKQRLSNAQLRLVLNSLQDKTGFTAMHFDEAGFLVLGDRTHFNGGSATARWLLIAAVDAQQAFELEAYKQSSAVIFAQIAPGDDYYNFRTKERIETLIVRLDFADFAELRGDREAVAAFDPGFAVMHELVHGILQLHDAVGDTTQVGACDEYINRVRRELNIPERRGYTPRLQPKQSSVDGRTTMRAELVFSRTGSERARNKNFYLNWYVEKVGSPTTAASQPGANKGNGAVQ